LVWGDGEMGITSGDRLRHAGIGAGEPRACARGLWPARGWTALRVLVIAAAASLAACAQPAVFADKPEPEVVTPAPVLAADPEPEAKPVPVRKPKPSKSAKERAATGKPTAEKKQTTYYGLASYYHHTRVASGEKFDPKELTAAHRTLPFGTRVRVTELKTGRSVTVRINDRGPFIDGRIVDVSKSAAAELGLISRGITKVKLEVIDDGDADKTRTLAKRGEPSYAAAH
jgi:peptidoglycan lytic transglycosylase